MTDWLVKKNGVGQCKATFAFVEDVAFDLILYRYVCLPLALICDVLATGVSWRSLGKSFSASAGVTISRTAAPALHKVLNRLLTDAALTVFAVKSRYPRMRPDTCLPYDSWPSGHATTGRLWALMLSDVFPQNADRLERRAFEFGESRIICHAHWHSDVCAGYRLAKYLYAQLLQNARYLEQIEAAKEEQCRGFRKQEKVCL